MLQLLRNKYRTLHAGMRLYNVLLACLLCTLLAACDVEDERDLCCDRIVMEYQYLQEGEDAFKENIRILRHFLFDGQGRFLQEVPPGDNPQLQILEPMETGSYTMVTVANATNRTVLTVPTKGSRLKDFMLRLEQPDTGNADKLYYGICNFALVEESGDREQRFVTQLANVHCKLKVTVRWQNLPPVLTSTPIYQLVLEECATNYQLDAVEGYSLAEKCFPHSPDWQQRHTLNCSLRGLELIEEFISLRYTDHRLPVLRILCRQPDEKGEYEEITPALDLKKAFTAWGYNPSAVERQEYKIIVTIYLDKHVGVKVELEAGVADWVDGGSFG